MLDDLGLTASLEWQARDFEKRSGIPCKLNLAEVGAELDKEKSLAIFRIMQEAFTNIARYSKAKNVEIRMKKTDVLVTFEVHDDGRGIKEEDILGIHSTGLIGMRERVEELDGSFYIEGRPGDGTTIIVTFPIKKQPVSDPLEGEDA